MVHLFMTATAHAAQDGGSNAPLEVSGFVLGVTVFFGLATLITGAVALFFNRGMPLLVDGGELTRDGETVRAPNIRGWGARQLATGIVLWAALLFGHPVLFEVGLASVLIRQVLDVVAKALDGKFMEIPPFLVLAVPASIALYLVV
ncbi:MAG: hypothetical protein ACI8RZ_007280 [Myxococcota bacterium]|jgi:hypothetical protein